MTPHLKLIDGPYVTNVFTDDRFENALFWNLSCPIILLSVDGEILEANDSMCDLLGYASSELCRMNITDITYNTDSSRDTEMRKECITSDRNEYSMDKRYLSKKEKVIWVKSQCQTIRNRDGKVENFLMLSTPLPNGGTFKIEKDEVTGEIKVKPIFSIPQFLKDDWKTALGIGLLILWSLFDKLRDNFKMIIDLLH